MVTCGDQEQRGGIGADAVQGKQAGRTAGHQGDDELIQVCELTAGELRSPSQLPQRDAGGVADNMSRTRT